MSPLSDVSVYSCRAHSAENRHTTLSPNQEYKTGAAAAAAAMHTPTCANMQCLLGEFVGDCRRFSYHGCHNCYCRRHRTFVFFKLLLWEGDDSGGKQAIIYFATLLLFVRGRHRRTLDAKKRFQHRHTEHFLLFMRDRFVLEGGTKTKKNNNDKK